MATSTGRATGGTDPDRTVRPDAPDVVTDWGLTKLGIENAPPMITRALLFDVAGADGGAHLNAGRTVTPDDLKRAVDEQTACIVCHTIAGTPASGTYGPDLTHLMSRQTIAAGAAQLVADRPAGVKHCPA